MELVEKFYTMSEAARYARVTRQTVARWIKEKEFKAEKIGREMLISKEPFERYVKEKRADILFDSIISDMTNRVRIQYGYTEKDKIEVGVDKRNKHAYLFLITREDGNMEVVRMIHGIAQPLEQTKDQPFVYIGYKLPVQMSKVKHGE